MGIRLIVEVLEYAPADLTWRERYALTVLAENANDGTRKCWPGIEDDDTIAHRMRLPSRSSRYEVMKALREKKAIETVSAGHRGRRAVYRIADMAPAKGPGTTDPIGGKGSGNDGASVRESRTQTSEKGPESPDPMPEKGSGNDPERVREPHGKGPGTTDPFPSYPSTPSVLKDSSAPPAADDGDDGLFALLAAAPATPTKPSAAENLAAFEDFYRRYPKSKARAQALRAWEAAIARGVPPEHITAAADRYADERANGDAKFTKYPATWLNGECYDDEPDPEPTQKRGGSVREPVLTPEDWITQKVEIDL